MEIKDMIELMKAVSENGLTTFQAEQGDWKILMKKEAGEEFQERSCQTGIEVLAQQREEYIPETESSGNIVKSPLVGTFYSAPSPESENFVKVGDHVKKGQTIGIIEAMKLMNEIECEWEGEIKEILVKNGEMVEYGQPLFCIR